MAQIREIRLVDDLDGEVADETVEFGVDGKNYEIDLSTANAKKLRDALAEFVAASQSYWRPVCAISGRLCVPVCRRRLRLVCVICGA